MGVFEHTNPKVFGSFAPTPPAWEEYQIVVLLESFAVFCARGLFVKFVLLLLRNNFDLLVPLRRAVTYDNLSIWFLFVW